MGQSKKSCRSFDNKVKKLFNVEVWLNKNHISTVSYNLPYALSKSIKRLEDIKYNNSKGQYTKIVPNKAT